MAKAAIQLMRAGVASPAPQPPDDLAEQDTDLRYVFGTIWRGKLWIAACTLLALFLGGYYAYAVAVPVYRSTSTVMLETRQEQVVSLESVMGGLSADTSVVNTEVEVLQSRLLLGKVVDRLNLIEDPEFNHRLRDETRVTRFKAQIKSLLGMARDASELPEEEEQARARAGTVSALKDALLVRNIPNSLVFSITAETTGPRKSAVIANTLVDQYITDQLESKFEATETATVWLTQRVSELQIELEEAEEKVKQFRASTDLTGTEALTGMEQQLKSQRERLQSLQVSYDLMAEKYSALKSAQTREEQAAAVSDTSLSQLLTRIDNPSIQESFDARVEAIMNGFETDMSRDESRIEGLRNLVADLELQLDKQNDESIELQQLAREAEASRLLYEYFLTRLKETSAQQGVQQPDSRILSRAEVAAFPSAPRKSLILAASVIFGFLAGVVLVLLQEMRRDTFRDAFQLEGFTGYNVTGQIPTMKARSHLSMVDYLIKKPTSATAEAVRNLRTSIMLTDAAKPPQIIMLTSSIPGEGKSTLSMALAQNFASLGKNTLLIEGDTRRRVLSRYLGSEEIAGLSDVLNTNTEPEQVIVREEKMGVSIMPAGRGSSSTMDRFSSARFEELIQSLREKYDYIIIDTPPILIVPDARVIMQYVDTVQFVVQWDSTHKDQVLASLRLIGGSGRAPVGLVLNKINPKGMRRYGYGSYYGSYGGAYYSN